MYRTADHQYRELRSAVDLSPQSRVFTMKKIIAFDLDGTLASRKKSVDGGMGRLLASLLTRCQVAIILGGDWQQVQKQLVGRLPTNSQLADLFRLPATGTKFHRYDNGRKLICAELLTAKERVKILASFESALSKTEFRKKEVRSVMIEDRGRQIMFSGLGQQAPHDTKSAWDPDAHKRTQLKTFLDRFLPDFNIGIGGAVSVAISLLALPWRLITMSCFPQIAEWGVHAKSTAAAHGLEMHDIRNWASAPKPERHIHSLTTD